VEEEEEEAWTPYGGTFTFFGPGQNSEPPSPAIADGMFPALSWLAYMQEMPVIGDVEKYGANGTGEWDFKSDAYQPADFMKGLLLESWETSLDKMVWHVRPGIHWQGTNAVKKVMENRELTAEDIAADINRFRDSPMGARFIGMMGDVYATDKYTVVIEIEKFSHELMYYIGYEDRCVISPPEVEVVGADKWENQVGTGPWMFEEYIPGSYMSFKKNPNYWGTTTINGVEYQMPFIDRVVCPIIPDMATQLASLRTGVVELYHRLPPVNWSILDTQSPQLLKSVILSASLGIVFKCDEPPFDDVNVRRAMMIGTEGKAFQKLVHLEVAEYWNPIPSTTSSAPMPFEEMPADIRILYDYNPELAMDMLADAGYPDGLEIKLLTGSEPAALDLGALVKDQWAKIGVEVEIDACDSTTFSARTYAEPRAYSGTMLRDLARPIPTHLLMFYKTDAYNNFGDYSNPEMDEILDKINVELDPRELTRLIGEAALFINREVPAIPTHRSATAVYWWPWLKNYHGELGLHDYYFAANIKFIWIDQDLKEDMGY